MVGWSKEECGESCARGCRPQGPGCVILLLLDLQIGERDRGESPREGGKETSETLSWHQRWSGGACPMILAVWCVDSINPQPSHITLRGPASPPPTVHRGCWTGATEVEHPLLRACSTSAAIIAAGKHTHVRKHRTSSDISTLRLFVH